MDNEVNRNKDVKSLCRSITKYVNFTHTSVRRTYNMYCICYMNATILQGAINIQCLSLNSINWQFLLISYFLMLKVQWKKNINGSHLIKIYALALNLLVYKLSIIACDFKNFVFVEWSNPLIFGTIDENMNWFTIRNNKCIGNSSNFLIGFFFHLSQMKRDLQMVNSHT